MILAKIKNQHFKKKKHIHMLFGISLDFQILLLQSRSLPYISRTLDVFFDASSC